MHQIRNDLIVAESGELISIRDAGVRRVAVHLRNRSSRLLINVTPDIYFALGEISAN